MWINGVENDTLLFFPLYEKTCMMSPGVAHGLMDIDDDDDDNNYGHCPYFDCVSDFIVYMYFGNVKFHFRFDNLVALNAVSID